MCIMGPQKLRGWEHRGYKTYLIVVREAIDGLILHLGTAVEMQILCINQKGPTCHPELENTSGSPVLYVNLILPMYDISDVALFLL